MIRFAILVAWLAGICSAAQAAGFSASYSDWVIRGNDVRVRVELPAADARRTMAPDLPLTQEGIANYVAAHIAVRSAGGACPALDQGFDLGKIDPLAMVGNRYRFEIFFRCPGKSGIVLGNSVLFGQEPAHLDFAHLEIGNLSVEKLFTRQRQTIPLAAAAKSDGALTFLPIGLDHVWHNWDHVFFLIGLLLVVRTRRDLLLSAAGFVSGYSLSAIIGLTGLIAPDAIAAQALSGVALILLAIEAIVAEKRNAAPVAAAVLLCFAAVAAVPAWEHHGMTGIMVLGAGLFSASYCFLVARNPGADIIRLVPTSLFALLDGLSFIPPTIAIRLDNLVAALTGFDLGAFTVQILVLAALFFVLTKTRFMRADGEWPHVRSVTAAALCAIGFFWLTRDYWII